MFTTITYRMARVLTLLALVVTMLVGALPAWADGATVIRGDIIDILGQPPPHPCTGAKLEADGNIAVVMHQTDVGCH